MKAKPTYIESPYRPGMRVRYHTRVMSPNGQQARLKDQAAVLVRRARGESGASGSWIIQVDGEKDFRLAKASELAEDILPPLAWPGGALEVTHSRQGSLLFGQGYEPPSVEKPIRWDDVEIPYEVDHGR